MVERVEELNLPTAIISRLIKESLPAGVNVSKDAKCAITRAASVFILYITSSANTIRLKQKNRLFKPQYIFEALEETEFESFIPPLKVALEAFSQSVKDKKDKKKDETDKKDSTLNQSENVTNSGDIESDEEVEK